MCEAAQHRYREFAAENHGHHPGRREIHLDERHQRRGHQQLVGQRIHQLTKRGHLFAASGQISVQPVGHRGEAEDRRTEQPLTSTTGPWNFVSSTTTSSGMRKIRPERQRIGEVHLAVLSQLSAVSYQDLGRRPCHRFWHVRSDS